MQAGRSDQLLRPVLDVAVEPLRRVERRRPRSGTGPLRHDGVRVLVVGNHFDPATPYEGAVAVADLMPNSRLLTVVGWGHTSLGLSVCADEAVARYLVDGALPVPGAVCAQDVVPFIAPGAAEVTVAAAESQAAKIVHTINSPSGGRADAVTGPTLPLAVEGIPPPLTFAVVLADAHRLPRWRHPPCPNTASEYSAGTRP